MLHPRFLTAMAVGAVICSDFDIDEIAVDNVGEPIHVYIPFISETQDEKMYRVVMDRERWFKVVMGENYSIDAQTTERLAERVPIPMALAEDLSFKLGVVK